jgi:hypothetical protein
MSVLSTVVLVTAVLTFFLGITMVVINLTAALAGRAGVSRGLNSIEAVYRAAAVESGERAAGVGVSSLTQLGRAATPGTVLARLRRRLDYAGNPPYWTVGCSR